MIGLITDENTVEPESDATVSGAPLALTFPGYNEEQAARPSKAPEILCEAPKFLAVARPARSLNSCGYLSLGFGDDSAACDVPLPLGFGGASKQVFPVVSTPKRGASKEVFPVVSTPKRRRVVSASTLVPGESHGVEALEVVASAVVASAKKVKAPSRKSVAPSQLAARAAASEFKDRSM